MKASAIGWFVLEICLLVFTMLLSCGDDDDDNDDADVGDDDDDDDNDDDNNDDDTVAEVWTDAASGRMWQVTAAGGLVTWSEAMEACDDLVLAGYDDWRLPTISELRGLIDGCPESQTGGACGVNNGCLAEDCMNSACDGCEVSDGPESGCYWVSWAAGTCSWYWSASKVADLTEGAWGVHFTTGGVYDAHISTGGRARCVRLAEK